MYDQTRPRADRPVVPGAGEKKSNGVSDVMSWFRGKRERPPTVLGTLEIRRPWVRSSSHPLPNCLAGAFLSITNKGPEADRLVAASSPLAEQVEIHGIKVVGADVKMRPLVDGLDIQAGDTKELKPRGYHLLLHGLKAPLVAGAIAPVTLTFEKAGSIAVDFDVEEPGLVGEAILNEEHHRR